ncbi:MULTISPECIES: multicopper oxidase family protein [Kitasatospora]|uniref:multicopper oxidase family protein n=1 Tax=Kitasatospora TaxID=2063 RepID=UPI000CB3D955|nr:multicopper oxidase family protein [Kitasatospora sp. GP30]MDH6142829.1 suppressor of ftsI [Kitasatospora sp. GP30]
MAEDTTRSAAARRRSARRTQRMLHALTALALALSAAVGTAAMADSPTDSVADSPPPSTADQEKGMTSGLPLADPVTADTKRALTITLGAARTNFQVGGKSVYGESYAGTFVAPTLLVKPGSTVTVRLVNHLPVATSLHFHGLHISPAGDSDNPASCVAPGGTTDYKLAIPADHPLGTFWYHSHAMGTACPSKSADLADPGSTADMTKMADMADTAADGAGFVPGDVENQIFAGLSGALIVGDDRTLLPKGLQSVTAHTMVLKDVQLDADNHIAQGGIVSNNPTVRLVNGQLRPVLTMRPDETQLWRLVNAGADIFYQLRLDGYRFTVIGEDGTPVARVSTPDTLLLPPGKRYDVLVTAGAKAGAATLRTTAYSTGPAGDQYPDTALATVKIAGTPAAKLPAVTGGIRTAPADLSTAPIAQRRTVNLSQAADGSAYYLNAKQYAMGSSVFDTPAKLGTVEEWTIVNYTEINHPFHLHTGTFQVMSVNGTAQPYSHRQDTVVVDRAVGGENGQVVIRIAFTDYPGDWLFHCHIAAHEDKGMMSFIPVVR